MDSAMIKDIAAYFVIGTAIALVIPLLMCPVTTPYWGSVNGFVVIFGSVLLGTSAGIITAMAVEHLIGG